MWHHLNQLDRRWVFLAMLLAIGLPMCLGISAQSSPSTSTIAVFDNVENLPPGSLVVLSIDYDPSSEGELHPMTIGLMRHCYLKRHKVILLTLWPTAGPVIDRAVRQVIEEEFADLHLEYGKDYVLLGYHPGEQMAIQVLISDLRKSRPRDDRGESLDRLPITKDLRGLKDADLLVDVSAGYPGAKEWAQYAGTGNRVRIAAGSVGVQVPNMLPYLGTETSPGRLAGLIGAVSGAAEYEALLNARYPDFHPASGNLGQRRMGSQLWAHILIVSLIVLGNVLQWASRRNRGAT
jgi:hypothetical protein